MTSLRAANPGVAETLTPDLCIVGAGAGGLAVATAAAAFGVSTVLVEKGAMGGDRRAAGGIAIAALAAAARRAADIRAAGAFGLDAKLADIDVARVLAQVRQAAASFAPDETQERFEAMGVRVIRVTGRFLDDRTLVAGDVSVRARRFIVATGSRPATPDIEGLSETPHLGADTIFDLASAPAHLGVLGGDPAAIELAQAFVRLGSRVTLFGGGEALADFDPDMAELLRDRLTRDGVDWRDRAKVRSVAQHENGVEISAEGEGGSISCDALLVATGRTPAIGELDLDRAGVRHGADGIETDSGLRTSNRRIYAIGDCAAGQPRMTHAVTEQAARVARSALFRLSAKADARMVPRILFTDPEIARCGLSEAEARAIRDDVVTHRWPFSGNERARVEHAAQGHLKVIAMRRGEILGCAIIGRGASEMIALWSLAIARKARLNDMASLMVAQPTLSDMARRISLQSLAPVARDRWVRRALSLLRTLG
ncbi:NAD(P)/FAD-dependent oxidoreductase [Terrarubrum flagellatum]|uniref:dihydrolipoyl dehydrogenase family protein n=1 Tax=Terrirubrum flagellatum TaxID=2895980 RepID=UPI0031451BEA